ncbi:hypothetical protein GCM10010423_29150 [Streptomyces levis]|uniref:Uncharacterized protein n=1 Tax=Streptomyces levis TaxID=285566 RepID=A0ABN3NSN0_9ACTN
MTDLSANPDPKHPRRVDRWLSYMVNHLRKLRGLRRHQIHHHFLQGAAYKLGSGAVTLLILWWETRH